MRGPFKRIKNALTTVGPVGEVVQRRDQQSKRDRVWVRILALCTKKGGNRESPGSHEKSRDLGVARPPWSVGNSGPKHLLQGGVSSLKTLCYLDPQ